MLLFFVAHYSVPPSGALKTDWSDWPLWDMEVLPRMPHDLVVVDKQHERAEVGGWRLMCRRGPRIVCFEPGIGHGDSLGSPSGDWFDVAPSWIIPPIGIKNLRFFLVKSAAGQKELSRHGIHFWSEAPPKI